MVANISLDTACREWRRSEDKIMANVPDAEQKKTLCMW
jgi:hypothetical protein